MVGWRCSTQRSTSSAAHAVRPGGRASQSGKFEPGPIQQEVSAIGLRSGSNLSQSAGSPLQDARTELVSASRAGGRIFDGFLHCHLPASLTADRFCRGPANVCLEQFSQDTGTQLAGTQAGQGSSYCGVCIWDISDQFRLANHARRGGH